MRFLVFVVASVVLVPACGTGPTVVPAQPLPMAGATPALSRPTVSATPAKRVDKTALQIAAPPPAPPSPIATLLAAIPPAPVIPARTCPKVPKISTSVAVPGGGFAVIVTVSDYLSLAPIANIRVNIFHGDVCTRNGGCKPSHPHPENLLKMTGKTNAQGRAEFQVPDLEYSVVIPGEPIAGYLPFSEDYNMGKQKCHELSSEKRSANQRAILFDGFLVPDQMLTIRTHDDAIAGAMQLDELVTWLRDHQDAAITVRGGGSSWEVGFGYDNRFKRLVLINGFDGTQAMLGRWN